MASTTHCRVLLLVSLIVGMVPAAATLALATTATTTTTTTTSTCSRYGTGGLGLPLPLGHGGGRGGRNSENCNQRYPVIRSLSQRRTATATKTTDLSMMSNPSLPFQSTSTSTSASMSTVSNLVMGRVGRGGAASASATSATTATAATVLDTIRNWNSTPTSLFNTSLLAVSLLTLTFKVLQQRQQSSKSQPPEVNGSDDGQQQPTTTKPTEKPQSVIELQRKFLSVFWLLRCADWLQGPYFYEVYASKMFGGVQASMALVSRLFLTGFASTALFGPVVGRAVDTYGRKRGTLAFAVLYALGAISTKSSLLLVLFLGRICSGIGTSLLFSAPESWLVAEAQKSGDDPDGKYLGETFGMAYSGDSIVAILAGQLAGLAAANRGPTGPFELSTGFLMLGGLLALFLWNENVASKSPNNNNNNDENSSPSIKDAIRVIRDDPKIMLVGGVQSLFEAAMYIFVLQWPPAMSRAVAKAFGDGVGTPYGTVFSCFMACCLFGSTLFGQFAKMEVPTTETVTAGMLGVATVAMTTAAATVSSSMNLPLMIASFFAFEACVGMYFPSIGTLRSKYVPDSHRSVIMNLFGIPLNILVVGVFLSISRLGLNGALGISSAALALAASCMVKLNLSIRSSNKTEQNDEASLPSSAEPAS